jgi:hypothetical protein
MIPNTNVLIMMGIVAFNFKVDYKLTKSIIINKDDLDIKNYPIL